MILQKSTSTEGCLNNILNFCHKKGLPMTNDGLLIIKREKKTLFLIGLTSHLPGALNRAPSGLLYY